MVLKRTVVDGTRLLERVQAEYATVGGVAVNAYGYPRGTADLDVVVDVRPPLNIRDLLRSAREMGFKSDRSVAKATRAGMLTLTRGKEKVDILLAQTDAERDQVRTAILRPAFGKKIRVASPERLIVFKAISSTLPNREKDLDDARQVCLRTKPDRDLLDTLAKRHGPRVRAVVRDICRRRP